MNTIVYIALSILFFGCTFACGYCCAMTKVCKNMKEKDAAEVAKDLVTKEL